MLRTTFTRILLPALLCIGCAHNRPLTDEDLAQIRSRTILLAPLPDPFREPLAVYKRSGKVLSTILTAALTMSISIQPQGATPREKMKGQSPADSLIKTLQDGMAEDISAISPTERQHALYAQRFAASPSKPDPEALTIRIKPMAWHLYYADGDTFTLEYASDTILEMPAHNIRRHITCDRISGDAIPLDAWSDNNALRIRHFAEESAQYCVQQVLRELKMDTPAPETAPAPAAESHITNDKKTL